MEREPRTELEFQETPQMQDLRRLITPEISKEDFIEILGRYQDLGQQSIDAKGLDSVHALIQLTLLTAQLRIQAGRDPINDLEDALVAAEAIGDWNLVDRIEILIRQSAE